MAIAHPQIDFIAIRCPQCDAHLFSLARTVETFIVRIKCRRCTNRCGFPVYLIVEISLAPLLKSDIDLNPEHFAPPCASGQ